MIREGLNRSRDTTTSTLSSSFAVPSSTTVAGLARSWAAKNPELVERIGRAVALVPMVTPGDYSPDVYFVEGATGNKYIVRINRTTSTSTCSCPDNSRRQIKCKHIVAVALVERGRAIEAAAIKCAKLPAAVLPLIDGRVIVAVILAGRFEGEELWMDALVDLTVTSSAKQPAETARSPP